MKKVIIAAVAIIVILALGLILINRNNSADQLPNSVSNQAEVSAPDNGLNSNNQAIAIQNFSFSQPIITVKKGDMVVWINKDSAPHTVTGADGGPSSPTINKNESYSFKFDNIGTFNYLCSFHPSMKGVVIVTQ